MYKRLFSALLAALMILSLAACGKQSAKNQGTGHIKDGFVFEGYSASDKVVDLGTPKTELDPQEVYNKLTYTPEMFFGKYQLRGGEKGRNEFTEQTPRFTWVKDGKEVESSVLPFEIRAGRESTMNHAINYIKEYNWMQVKLPYEYRENEYSWYELYCAYDVQGNKLILKPLDTFEVDKETNKITYTFSDMVLEYNFSFSGRNLTLSSGENSVTLTTGMDTKENDYFYVDGYLSANSQSLANIDRIEARYESKDGDSRLLFVLKDDTRSYTSVAVLQENGLFTFTLGLDDSQETYQYVYFYGGDDGLVLTDGTNTYYYNDTYSDRNKLNASKFLTEDQTGKLDELTDSQLEAIVEKTENLLEDLAAAYQQAGLNVTVNTQTGEIALDSTVLFGVNESDVSAEGKEFLKKFIQVYTSVVFSDKYENFVSTIMVEGHTDTNGSYELNQKLSQARADSVKNYCLSEDCGVEQVYASALQDMLQAVGYSYDKPIYDEKGEVNMDASRRVSFRFIVNLDQ